MKIIKETDNFTVVTYEEGPVKLENFHKQEDKFNNVFYKSAFKVGNENEGDKAFILMIQELINAD